MGTSTTTKKGKNLSDSEAQFSSIILNQREIFKQESHLYGCAWGSSDYPKAFNEGIAGHAWIIRLIQNDKNKSERAVIERNLSKIFNDSMRALIKHAHGKQCHSETRPLQLVQWFNEQTEIITEVRVKKNHDYDEAWRDMRMHSFIDLILMRTERIAGLQKQTANKTISEPADQIFIDIANYCIFALFRIDEGQDPLK